MDFGEHYCTQKSFEQGIDTGRGISLIGGYLVEFSIIDTKAGSPILPFCEQDRGTPQRGARFDKLLLS